MNRVASTILIASGAALLATQLISPADSSPRPAALAEADARPDQDAAALEAVKTEIDRLRERTKSDPGFPAPTRDPFNFGKQPERPRPPAAAVTTVPEARPVVLPALIAILSDGTSDSAKRTVVFARGDNVDFVGVGESINTFRVDSVTADAVVLVDAESGQRYRVALQN
jgi:hypothetical protein